MNTTDVSSTYTFDAESVEEWCEQAGDSNEIHLDEDAASSSEFGERIVPGMMILDKVSGLLEQLGTDDETVVIHTIVGVRFRDPISLDEPVEIGVEIVEEDDRFTTVEFTARTTEKLAVQGSVNIVFT